MNEQTSLIPIGHVKNSILFIRGQKVILDADLAKLYGTTTKRLNEQVRRNLNRFPSDFMFQLMDEEFEVLKTRFEAHDVGGQWGKKRYPPYAFTEHGAIMAAGLINTPLAIEVSIFVVRAFIQLRQHILSHEDLARKLDALEQKYDTQFSVVFDAIRQLMAPPKPKKNQIGFHWEAEKPAKKKAPARKTVVKKKKEPESIHPR